VFAEWAAIATVTVTNRHMRGDDMLVGSPLWCGGLRVDAAESDDHIAWVRALWDRVEPELLGSVYINHMMGDDRPERVLASYGNTTPGCVS
jgi:hypothetical protein